MDEDTENLDLNEVPSADPGLFAVMQSEESFKALIDVIPAMVWLGDDEGRIRYFNEEFYRFTGHDRDDDDGYVYLKIIHPDDMHIPPLAMEHVKRGEKFEFEVRHRAADGSYRWFLVRAIPLPRKCGQVSYVGTNTDIDEQKRATEELAESEARLSTLAEAIPQIVWTADSNGEINFLNQRYFEFTGLSVEQSVDGAWQLLIHPEDRSVYMEGWQESLESGDTFEASFRLKRATGLSKVAEYRRHLCRAVAARGHSGQILQWFGTWTDVEMPPGRAQSAISRSG
ncbi:MAG: PAS domain-containing protein [Candidatus Obscuribacterales bacterium]